MGGGKCVHNVVPRLEKVYWYTILFGSMGGGKCVHNVVTRWGRVDWYTILLKLEGYKYTILGRWEG